MKKQSVKNTIITSRYMFLSVWNKSGGKTYILTKLIIAALDSLEALVYVMFPGMIIDELLNNQRYSVILGYILALCGIPILNAMVHLLLNTNVTKLKQELDLAFSIDYYSYVADMDFELNESPEIQMLKSRAQQTLEASVTIVDSLLGLVSSFLRLLLIFTVIITMNPIIIILVVVQVCINAYIAEWLNKQSHDVDIKTSTFARKIYANTCVFDDDDYAKELRLFDLKNYIINLFINNKKQENNIWLKHRRNQFKAYILKILIQNIQQLIVYVLLVYNVLKNMLPIGQLTIYLASINQFSGALGQLFSSYVDLFGRSLKIDELIQFMNIPMKKSQSGTKQPYFTKDSVIEFKNVSFRYPGSESYALKNVNIKFRSNDKLCIVGANGSGKSTFIKLITRLYMPTEGMILLNGVNINEYDYKQYLELFAPVFQDYQLLFMSLRENVVLAKNVDDKLLEKVYSDSNLDILINSLKYSDETQVYKWECAEGFEPSGGEGQRIAIARALYHNRKIYLLDEPTAALDPSTEYEMYTQFHDMIQNKSAILITHRLSAVQLADKVAVFDNGSIVEYGTHKDLYEKDGIYTEMFDKQAEFYRYENVEEN